jgi:uncharacterized protein HemY
MTTRLTQIQTLLAAHPQDELLWFTLGREQAKEGLIKEAALSYEKAVALKPAYSTAYREWGQALARLDRAEEAERVFRRGLTIAEETGDLQVKRELETLLKRLIPPPG